MWHVCGTAATRNVTKKATRRVTRKVLAMRGTKCDTLQTRTVTRKETKCDTSSVRIAIYEANVCDTKWLPRPGFLTFEMYSGRLRGTIRVTISAWDNSAKLEVR